MRLFLDAHVSGRRVASELRKQGHDVRAADEDRALDGWRDEELLVLATAEERIFVTFDAKDFARITRRWGEEGRLQTGCMIIVGIDHSEFGTILAVIGRVLTARPDPDDWSGYVCFASRQ